MAGSTTNLGLTKPTYAESQDVTILNGNMELIDAEAGKVRGNFAGAYDASGSYAVGDYCIYNGVLYRCTTAISGGEAWNSNHWSQVNVGDELGTLSEQMATNLNYNSTIILNNGNSMGEYSDSALYTLLKNDSNVKQSQFCYFAVGASGGKRYGWCYLYDAAKNYGSIFVCRYGENPRYVAVVDGAVSLRQLATT